MPRIACVGVTVLAAALGSGCAQTWDTLTSRRFREHPWTTLQQLVRPPDPVAVLLAEPPASGDDQAAALRRLTLERWQTCSPEQQAALWPRLEQAATADASPIVRMEAIRAVGRLAQPQGVPLLLVAYQRADGLRPDELLAQSRANDDRRVADAPASAGRRPTRIAEPFPLAGPQGYPSEWTNAIRCQALEALGQIGSPEAVHFLAMVAQPPPEADLPGANARDVRLAAVRALGRCRQPQAVAALAQVLEREVRSADTAMVHRAHEGLVRLTGQKLPPDPYQWQQVVQAGAVVAPEPGWWEQTAERFGKSLRQAVLWLR